MAETEDSSTQPEAPFNVRVVHRNGEVKSLAGDRTGEYIFVFWPPLAGWYRLYLSSGRVEGARSWHVHPEDLIRLRPKRKRKRKTKDEVAPETAPAAT